MAGNGGEMERLADAVERLATSLSHMNAKVHVPLYANTFPLATVAKLAALKRRKQISITPFDWNWSQDSRKDPPFVTSHPWQLFFATASEFSRIHAAGISFFAVPASVFHPRHVFIGLPKDREATEPVYVQLGEDLKKALSARPTALPLPRAAARDACQFTWVSDIPDQAEMLALRVEEFLGSPGCTGSEALVHFWQNRPLSDALKIDPGSTTEDDKLKAFIWGGPLTSVAQRDAEKPKVRKDRAFDGSLKLRDPWRESLQVPLPSLLDGFSEDEISERHALYCCIGYKEGRSLQGYYTSGNHIGDKPWDLRGRKFAAMHRSRIPAMVSEVREFFRCLFEAAQTVPPPPGPDENLSNREVPNDIFQSFLTDYDKFCRTKNPIAQLYIREEYAKCLREHHDQKAFDALFVV